ncbi:hypothetical protein EYF80_057260 [Liparis tanakae]|uniref:Uncharacterized protein n=1 Tax=Liparis tanakae TaxID=230148 RepID=A0A4Z2EVA6_9TELE|nr:hypothetical protein EYF80_057260 [Liparis tanakae]
MYRCPSREQPQVPDMEGGPSPDMGNTSLQRQEDVQDSLRHVGPPVEPIVAACADHSRHKVQYHSITSPKRGSRAAALYGNRVSRVFFWLSAEQQRSMITGFQECSSGSLQSSSAL